MAHYAWRTLLVSLVLLTSWHEKECTYDEAGSFGHPSSTNNTAATTSTVNNTSNNDDMTYGFSNGEESSKSQTTPLNITLPMDSTTEYLASRITKPGIDAVPTMQAPKGTDYKFNEARARTKNQSVNSRSVELKSNMSTAQSAFDYKYINSRSVELKSNTSTVRTGFGYKFFQPEEKVNNSLPNLYIGGLFELSGAPAMAASGHSQLAAAKLAIQHINEKRFIPGYTLSLVFNDTKCDPGVGADAFYDFVYKKPKIMMLIGTACSEVTKTLAEIVPYWNLVLVSYAAASPALSDREKYPTFYRLAAADSSHNAARRAFIQNFGWNTVATLHQDMETYSLAMNDMDKDFQAINMTLKATETFSGTGDDLRAKMKKLRDTDARIIIGSFQEDAARQVFCEAYHLGLYGGRYVWMLLGWYTKHWWTLGNDTNCTPQQLSQAVEGYFSVDSLNFIIGKRKSISGLTTEKFLEKYRQVDATTHHSAYVQLTYDTVWTVALTLRETMLHWEKNDIKDVSLSDFTYHEGAVLKEAFFSIMGDLEFTGVSGPISFDGPDRRGITVIEQNQGGEEVRIALFYPENNTLDFKCEGCTPVYWKNDKVPADKFTILTRQEHVGTAAFYTVFTVGSFGIIFAVVFLAFNLHYRKLKYIKLSSPRLNNVAVIGCLLVYTAVILLGLDDATLDMQFFPLVCSLRAFLLAAGFSMAFGAMFTKTYRVHQILTRTSSGLVKSRLLKDKQLLFIIGALLIVDSIIISLWVLIDPMDRQVQNFTVEASDTDEDLLYIPQLSKCHSQHLDKWMGVFYAYKGLLLIFGVYMAWETRHVKIPALNDSQYIGLNVYNVVLMSVIVVALSSLLADQPTLSYAVVSAFIILSTTIMLCLLFLPKFYAIIKHSGNPVITTSGLMVEANTRRFATDDKKEQFYRAEVQNRVYKREIVELDQEIIRLERMLELPLEPFTKMTDELMYLLPESKVDTTPIAIRRRKAELERCDSITDADDVATDLPSISFGSLPVIEKRKLEKEDSGFHTMSFKNSNFKTLEQERLEIDNEEEDHTNGRCSVSRNRKLTRGLSNDSAIEPSLSYGSIRRQNSFDGDQEEKCSLLMEDEEREQAENEIELLFGHTDANSYRSNSVGAAEAFGCREILTSPTEHGSRTSIELSDFSSKSGATNTVTPNGAEGHNEFQKRKVTVMEKPSSIRTFESDSYELDDSERDSLSPKQMSKPERRRRIRILQRELARIQQELKNLGDIEMEVSYV